MARVRQEGLAPEKYLKAYLISCGGDYGRPMSSTATDQVRRDLNEAKALIGTLFPDEPVD